MQRTVPRYATLISLVIALCAPLALGAESPRYALVIGNGAYADFGKLKNPVNDATDVAAALKKLGFQVQLLTDASRKQMNQGLNDFYDKLVQDPASEGFFWYAGHGVQSKGENYLVPIGSEIRREADLEDEAVSVRKITALLDDARNRVNVVVLDACRNNPIPTVGRSGARGLTVVSAAPPESVIMYSTGAGQVAADGSGRNSPFAQAFLTYLAQPGDITATIKAITAETKRLTGGSQVPYLYSSLTVDFALARGSAAAAAPKPAIAGPDFGEVIVASGTLTISLATAGTVTLAGKDVEVPAGGSLPVRNLRPGSYDISVIYEDGNVEKDTVEILPGQAASLSFEYAPTAFAKPGVHYLAGDLHVLRNEDGDLYLWHTARDFAVEIIKDSNGWWRLRLDGEEYVVYSSGRKEKQSFYDRPWSKVPEPEIVSDYVSFELVGKEGKTTVSLDDSMAAILLSDGGSISIPTKEPYAAYLDSESAFSIYPEETDNDGFGKRGVHFAIGDLHMLRTDDRSVCFWYASGKLAVEVWEGTNGWWNLRYDEKEYTIFPGDPCSKNEASFFARPWESAPAAKAVSGDARFATRGESGTISFEAGHTAVKVAFADGSSLSLSTRSQQVKLANSSGSTVVFPAALKDIEEIE